MKEGLGGIACQEIHITLRLATTGLFSKEWPYIVLGFILFTMLSQSSQQNWANGSSVCK